MPNSPSHKSFAAESPDLSSYVERTFAPEDAVLAQVRVEADKAQLPPIHVSPFDGRHLEVLVRAMGAKKIVEIGTLAGYSGTCLARGMPSDGVLHTFEFEPRHAAVAQETFRRAGVADRVRIHIGAAINNLPKIEAEGPFDVVFIDADKPSYPHYLAWAEKHLRLGGVVLADNAFAWGLLTASESDERFKQESNRVARQAIGSLNARLADPRGPWRSTMWPTGEGLAMGVRVR